MVHHLKDRPQTLGWRLVVLDNQMVYLINPSTAGNQRKQKISTRLAKIQALK